MTGYLKLGDIQGESSRSGTPGKLGSKGPGPSYYKYKFSNLIITSYDTSGSSGQAPGSTKSGVAGSGTMKVVMPISKQASPFRALSTSGSRSKSVTVVDHSPKSDQKGACTYTLYGVKFADTATKADTLPQEEMTLSYEKIEWTYGVKLENVMVTSFQTSGHSS
jgi:hypothetical protein